MTIPHVADMLGSAAVFGVIAHAVQSFPTPSNKYGAWLLGAVQYAVGQRERAMNTLAGADTSTAAIQRGHQ